MLKFTLQTESGRWVGGFMVGRKDVEQQLIDLRAMAALWKEPLVAIRVGKLANGERHVIPVDVVK